MHKLFRESHAFDLIKKQNNFIKDIRNFESVVKHFLCIKRDVCCFIKIVSYFTGCDDGAARLVNGDTLNGRLELCISNTWNTVCKTGFDDEDAAVICRQLNLPSTGKQVLNSHEY